MWKYSTLSDEEFLAKRKEIESDLDTTTDSLEKANKAIIKHKVPLDWGEAPTWLSQADVDRLVKENLALTKFQEAHPHMTPEQVQKVIDFQKANPWLTLDEAVPHAMKGDESYHSTVNAMGLGIETNTWTQKWVFTKRLTNKEYESLPDSQKKLYEDFSTKEFWGFTLQADSSEG